MANETHGIQLDHMDISSDPGKDFYTFANGGWIKGTQMPASETRWGVFDVLRESTAISLRDMFEELSRGQFAIGSDEQKIGDFYAAAMDENKINARGFRPLVAELGRISKLKNIRSSAALLARLHHLGVGVLFGFGSMPDFDNSTQNIAVASQGGISMPDPGYYLGVDQHMVELRRQFTMHVARMFLLLGVRRHVAARYSQAVLSFETELAKAFMDKADAMQPSKTNNKMSRAAFVQSFAALPLGTYFQKMGAPAFETINVMQPDYFQALNALLKKTPAWQLRAYLRWQLLTSFAGLLSKSFVDESFEFFGKQMEGAAEQQPRWKHMTSLTSGDLGEAVGKIYVARFFPPEAKARMNELFANVKEAFRESIPKSVWMLEESSHQAALQKLEHFEGRFGYPDKWRDYSALAIDRDCVVRNAMRAAAFESTRDIEKIGQPVDAAEWDMTPQTVNAEADPITLKLTFPAGILQPPFFDLLADDASIYGGIGAVIGHEGTHPFDHNGMQLDQNGNLRQWVAVPDKQRYESLTAKLIAQYSKFTTTGGVHVIGGRVVGEAAADLGLRIAYRALCNALAKQGKTPSKDATGYDDLQRFFIAFGQLWGEKATPEREDHDVLNDEHPEGRFRVSGTLANLPEFAQAFGLPEDCPMVLPKDERCDIW